MSRGVRRVAVEAPAKVNLFLRVLHRRPDGFHELETLFQSVSLADRVSVSLGPSVSNGVRGGRRVAEDGGVEQGSRTSRVADHEGHEGVAGEEIVLAVDGADLGPPESNLAYRAARIFRERHGLLGPVRIELAKEIPAGAGLGGGSSDAAAVLRCLAELSRYDDDDALRESAAALGSDVPFFLSGSPLAFGRGRGERLEALRPLPEAHLVLALPPVHVSTGGAYAELAAWRAGGRRDASGARDGDSLGAQGVRWSGGPGMPRSWGAVVEGAANDFQTLVAERHEQVRLGLRGLLGEGARMAMLSGSGAASFGLFDTRDGAEAAAQRLEERLGWRFQAVTTRTAVPPVEEREPVY